MVSLEEMTRRRDAWRVRAERAEKALAAERFLKGKQLETVSRQQVSIENLNSALAGVRREAAANLAWVRRLQRDIEHWKHNNKVLVRWFMDAFLKEGWRDDPHGNADCPEGSCVLSLWRAHQAGGEVPVSDGEPE